jgi:hypothetical protein
MKIRYSIILAAGMAATALGALAAAWAAPQAHGPAPVTKSLQGGADHDRVWTDNPHMQAFYELTVATLGKGAEKADFPAYQQKAYAIFREFGASMGWKPEAMADHLKDVPRQMVGIVKDDPKVLDNYANFRIALAGPP